MDEEKDVHQESLKSIFSKESLIELTKNKSEWRIKQEDKVKKILSWIVANNIKDPEIRTQLLSFKEIKDDGFNFKNKNDDDNIVENFLLYCYSKNYQDLAFTILYNNHSALLKTNKKTEAQLFFALNCNNYKCVDLILTKSDNAKKEINSSDKNGFTSLHWQIQKENVEIVEVLLKHKVSVNTFNKQGNSPLHCAVKKNNKEVVKVFLKHGVKVNARNQKGESFLGSTEQNQMQKNLATIKEPENHTKNSERITEVSCLHETFEGNNNSNTLLDTRRTRRKYKGSNPRNTDPKLNSKNIDPKLNSKNTVTRKKSFFHNKQKNYNIINNSKAKIINQENQAKKAAEQRKLEVENQLKKQQNKIQK